MNLLYEVLLLAYNKIFFNNDISYPLFMNCVILWSVMLHFLSCWIIALLLSCAKMWFQRTNYHNHLILNSNQIWTLKNNIESSIPVKNYMESKLNRHILCFDYSSLTISFGCFWLNSSCFVLTRVLSSVCRKPCSTWI